MRFDTSVSLNLFIGIVAAGLFSSCYLHDESCNQDGNDTILVRSNVVDSLYRKEVIRILHQRKPDDYRYYFKTFLREKDGIYMLVNFRRKGECFDVKVLVTRWDRLSGMLKTNGLSYPKELRNLDWEIVPHSGEEIVFYKNMGRMLD